MHRSRLIMAGGILALIASIGCDYSTPSAPDDSTPGPQGATISITSSGLTPSVVSITAGQSVTFVNNDAIAHEIVSTPVPTYSDCPPINSVSRLEPGESMQTGALTATGSCGFLDLLQSSDGRWQGSITIR